MRQSSMDDHLSNKRQYLYSLMKWIVTGFNNLDEVDDFYFREMLLSINPNIQLISRDALSDALMQQYQVIHYYVKRYISNRNFTIKLLLIRGLQLQTRVILLWVRLPKVGCGFQASKPVINKVLTRGSFRPKR